MSKKKTKELIVCIIALIVLMLAVVTDVFAMSIEDALGNNSAGNNFSTIPDATNTSTGNNTSNGTGNNIANNTSNNTTNTNKVNNTNRNNNATAIPNTGVDYSVVLIIAVCGISAVYAYKKIKDYNNF